jgi:hypothetical protein
MRAANLGKPLANDRHLFLKEETLVATTKQKEATKKNTRPQGAKIPKQSPGVSTSAKAKLPDNVYAFPKERKEPLTDAKHVRSAIARFDQVEGITDAEKDAAWKRIVKSAKKFDVDIHESNWRELGQTAKSLSSKKTTTAAKKPTVGAKKPTAAKKPAAAKR